MIEECSKDKRSLPCPQEYCTESDDVQCRPCQGVIDLTDTEKAIAARFGLTRREAIRGVIASGLDSITMLEWMFTISWEKYAELVEALVLDAGLTPSERSSMLGEDMPGGATQDASQMTLESIESNNGAKQYQTRTHSRGDVIAHKHYEQNHKKKIDESTSMSLERVAADSAPSHSLTILIR